MKLGKFRISLKNHDAPILLLIYGWGTFYYFQTGKMRQAAMMLALIQPIYLIMVGLGIVYLARTVKIERVDGGGEQPADPAAAAEASGAPGWWSRNSRIVGFTGILALYLLVMNRIGFTVATTLYLGGTMRFLGMKKWLPLCVISVASALAVYLIFGKFFYVKLPEGLLF